MTFIIKDAVSNFYKCNEKIVYASQKLGYGIKLIIYFFMDIES